eukprot:7887885-Ditylum_brightwellii.AAC.1
MYLALTSLLLPLPLTASSNRTIWEGRSKDIKKVMLGCITINETVIYSHNHHNNKDIEHLHLRYNCPATKSCQDGIFE